MRKHYGRESPTDFDKLVGNWLQVGFIRLALPNAKIICMRRNPYDSLRFGLWQPVHLLP